MVIIYHSNTGFTRQYAEMLAKAEKLKAYSADEAPAGLEEPVFFMGPLMAGHITGLDKTVKKYKVKGVCGVGMSPASQQVMDLLAKSNCKPLINEVSSFLMLAVYRMFRLVYSANPRNQNALFTIPDTVSQQYADAAMQIHCANALSISKGDPAVDMEKIKDLEPLMVTTEGLSKAYPLFASSLLNLIQNAETRVNYPGQTRK